MKPGEELRRAREDIRSGTAITTMGAIGRHITNPLEVYHFWDAALSASLADPRDGQGLKGWDYWEVWDHAIALAEAEE